jgi:hypothetical protein
MWSCSHCGEAVEDAFAVCWNCGTSRDGEPDPKFQREAPIEIDSEIEVDSENGPPFSSRVFWIGYRLLGLLGAALVGFWVPLHFDMAVRAGMPPMFREEDVMRSWPAVLVLVVAGEPVWAILRVAAARRSGRRLEWGRPSWSADPWDYSRPLEILYLTMWMGFVGGVAAFVALPAAANWRFPLAVCTTMFAGALSAWATIKTLESIYGSR